MIQKDIILGTNYRLIVTSDIHGNLDALKGLLTKVKFDYESDKLIIAGDVLEKGPCILDTLRFVMNLAKTSETYVVLGNCDTILISIAENQEKEYIKQYLLSSKNRSIVLEMCKFIGFEISPNMDIDELYNQLNTNFSEEIAFITNLPILIETEEFIFAHAGVESREDYRNSDYDYIVSHDRFYEQEYVFPKKVIVGHWATSLYFDDRFDVSPIIDNDRNVICVDGANSIKDYGQLNALINENDGTTRISFDSYDKLAEATVVVNQQGTKGVKVIWPYNQIEIVSENDTVVTGYLKSYSKRGYTPDNIGRNMVTIPKKLVYDYDSKTYSHEFMNELLDLQVGDTVKIVLDNNCDILVCKFNGNVGLVHRNVLTLD